MVDIVSTAGEDEDEVFQVWIKMSYMLPMELQSDKDNFSDKEMS